MSQSTTLVFEVRIGGSDANGGAFDSAAAGTDRSLQNAAQVAIDNATITCTTPGANSNTLTFTAGYTPTSLDVGNVVNISAGTNIAAGIYSITAQTSTTWTLQGAANLTTAGGAGSAIVGNMGGALATPGKAAAVATVAGNKIWWKYSATAYATTTATPGAGGPIALAAASTIVLEGYDVTRGDRTGNRPAIQWGAAAPGSNTYLIVGGAGQRNVVLNCVADGNSKANVSGFNVSNVRHYVADCVALNCNQSGAIGFNGNTNQAVRCQSSGCVTGFQNFAVYHGCDASGGTTGYSVASGVAERCLARGMATGFSSSTNGATCINCTADSCTTAGYAVGAAQAAIVNSMASNCSGGIGFNCSGGGFVVLTNCASYNNLTEISGTPIVNEGMTLNAAFTGGQPYVSAGSDFRPNATAGAGALLRGAGIGVFGQTDNADIGAVQHADPAGSNTYVVNKVINNHYYDSPEP